MLEVSPSLVAVWNEHMVHHTRVGLQDTACEPHWGQGAGMPARRLWLVGMSGLRFMVCIMVCVMVR